jgi:hypothetical protein
VVVDEKGCVASDAARINAITPAFTVNMSAPQNATCGLSTGSSGFSVISTTITEFDYQLDGYPAQKGAANSLIALTGLSAGSHSLRVWNECSEVVKEIIITNGANAFAFTADANKETLSCSGALIPGSITLTLNNGGVADYYYSINDGDWTKLTISGNTATIPNLHQGFYRVQVKDAVACTFEVNNITIEREIYTPISVGTAFAAIEPNCGAQNGAIQVYATGGSGSYLYGVNNATPISYPGGLITGLEAGLYKIAVIDSVYKTCDTVTINNIVLHNGATDLNVSLTPEDATSCNSKDGKLTVSITGGTTIVKHYFNGTEVQGAPNTLYENLETGVHTMMVVDENGCVASDAVRINAITPAFTVNMNTPQSADCGLSTGSSSFSVTSADITEFTYQLNGYPAQKGAVSSVIELTGLSAGIHSLRVWDECSEVVEDIIITNGANALSFTATSNNETLSCSGELTAGSITLANIQGDAPYQYSINNSEWKPLDVSSGAATIAGLHQGFYLVQVRDANGCTYERNNLAIIREISYGKTLTPPVATTPQTFCSTATVTHLQATGVNILWYALAEGGDPLDATHPLDSGAIYYAAQSVGYCESSARTAVKVYIDNNVEIEPPHIVSPQTFCNNEGKLTIADIATNGNTNIVWYNVATGGTPLALTDKLEEKTYYAAIQVGTCQSSPRVEVEVTFGNTNPATPDVLTPQSFCDGALIANIAVPNNKIVWYLADNGGDPLPATYVLENNKTYYAAQEAGECESIIRKGVLVNLTAPAAPQAAEKQVICGKHTLADLVITGAGIVWYNAEVLGDKLELTEVLVPGASYWAAQSSANCEGERVKITITNDCYQVYGTMFPFVHTGAESFDSKYPVTVKLLPVPAKDGNDPITTLLASEAVQTVKATYYDGSVHIPGTPKDPGVIGATNNPGEKINWAELGKSVGAVSDATVAEGEYPVPPVGMFKFENVIPGEYILEISRQGFIVRWAKVTISVDGMSLGHRELIAGDVFASFLIDGADVSDINSHIYDADNMEFAPKYDLNGDGNISAEDMQIIIGNMNANITTYLETLKWIMSHFE